MNRRYRIATALCLLLIAARQQQANGRQPPAKNADQASTAVDVDAVLARLRSKDETVRKQGETELNTLRGPKTPLTVDQGRKLLQAAAEKWPPGPNDHDVSADLARVVMFNPRPEWIPDVVRLYEKFSERARWYALATLASLEQREAAEAYMAVLRAHAKGGRVKRLMATGLERKPRHADVFFPEILRLAAVPDISNDVYRLCLAYCEAGLVKPQVLAPFVPEALARYEKLAERLRPAQQAKGVAWMWEEKYREPRFDAALLLDLLGHCPAEAVAPELRRALNYSDPRLKFFAIASLLRLGKEIPSEEIAAVAAEAETRNWLYQMLLERRQGSLFPKKYLTQAAFAASDMVNWLTYPTELGRVPDEIELMKVVPIDTGLPGGIYDYYLFRFRTHAPHRAAKDGWMAGVSGPFRRQATPSIEALGDTFSAFTKWDAKKPEEHVGQVSELMKKWREYHAKERN
jgi:hypothetical protein